MINKSPEDLKDYLMQKKIVGTLAWGVIINFIILYLLEIFNQSGYLFLLFVSLILGWIVSSIILKIEHKSLK